MVGTGGLTALSDSLVTSCQQPLPKRAMMDPHWGGSKLGYSLLDETMEEGKLTINKIL